MAVRRQLNPMVWIARLDEIATRGRARSEAEVEITDTANEKLRVTVTGPSCTTVLARGTVRSIVPIVRRLAICLTAGLCDTVHSLAKKEIDKAVSAFYSR